MRRREKQPLLVISAILLFVLSISILFSSAGDTQAITNTKIPFSSPSLSPSPSLSSPPTQIGPIPSINTIDDSVQGTALNQFNYSANGWQHCKNCGFDVWYGTKSSNQLAGSSVTFSFSGSQIALYGVRSADSGIGAVAIDDGTEVKVDFYASATIGNQLLWTSPSLSAGNHTLKVRVTGAKSTSSAGFVITLDRVDIIGSENNPSSSNCLVSLSSTATFQPPTNTPSGSSVGAAPSTGGITISPCPSNSNNAAIVPQFAPTDTPCPQPTYCNLNSLKARYFNGQFFETPASTRMSDYPNYPDWYATATPPALPTGIGPHNFSAIWTGQVTPPFYDYYTFSTMSDDGIRLWINDRLLIDDWRDGVLSDTVTIPLLGGVKYNIRVEYYENDVNLANAVLQWKGTAVYNKTPKPIPASLLNNQAISDLGGVWVTRNHTFYLKYNGNQQEKTINLAFAQSADLPVTGDWDGDGEQSIGVLHIDLDGNGQPTGTGHFRLVNNNINLTVPDYDFQPSFSVLPGDIPVAGRWNFTDTHDGIGIYRPSNQTFYLQDDFNQPFAFTMQFLGADANDIGFVGDWNGDGLDSPGIYRPSTSTFYLLDSFGLGDAAAVRPLTANVSADYTYTITNVPNSSSGKPVVGDWRGQGFDGVGIYIKGTTNGTFYLKDYVPLNTSTSNFDHGFNSVNAGDLPVVGRHKTLDEELASYGVIAQASVPGVWTDADKAEMLMAVKNVGLALSMEFGGGPPDEAFKRAMFANGRQIIEFNRLANSPNFGACQTTNGGVAPVQAIISCDASNHFSQYVAVHELGHVFEGRTGGTGSLPGIPTYYSLLKQPPLTSVPGNFNSALLDSANQVVLGVQLNSSRTPDWTRGNRGWGSAATPTSIAMFCDFQQDPNSVVDSQVLPTPSQTATIREIDEAGADMFLNWVYSKIGQGGFQNTDWRTISRCTTGTPQPTEKPGDARNHFMNDIVLPTLATYIPTPTVTPTP